MNTFSVYVVASACLLVVSVLGVAYPVSALAHSTGSFYEEVVGDYVVDIGYDPPIPRAGERFLLDFTLWDESKTVAIPYDDVWVRITQDSRTLVATGVAPFNLGPTTLLLKLPADPGNINISVRFERDGETLAEASFPLKVEQGEESLPSMLFFGFATVGGALFGAAAVLLIRFRAPSA